MLLLKPSQCTPSRKEEPGLGSPGSRDWRTLPQETFTLAAHPSGGARSDQLLCTEHLPHGGRIPPFPSHMPHTCSSSASPGCNDPPGSGLAVSSPPFPGHVPKAAVPAGMWSASREVVCHLRDSADTTEPCPRHGEFPCCSSAALPAPPELLRSCPYNPAPSSAGKWFSRSKMSDSTCCS